MKFPNTLGKPVAIIALAISMSACAGMTRSERNAMIGAAAGGVAGSVLTGGSTVATVGGAIAGGAIGNELGKKKR
ncbi:glycine zipper 2TM domain-containing protein [Methyloversatilis thermotolerans]|uniref:glycine zipper 2TM domain-containing protein n=1 Tax=Methyloversatilis thermotolerans TaxID=1346290 RepID=UPI00037E5A8E|nr:glycine zipper 2TM domain-containing protein [Methyloversatilis thermotolerans]